jgi:hypothetical protein
MPLDSEGIWQYEETDDASPVSGLLNLLAASTSTQIADVRSNLPADTGWVNLTLLNSWTASEGTPAVRRIGEMVFAKGVVTGGSAQLIANLPAAFIPSEGRRFFVWSSGSTGTILTMFASGALQSSAGLVDTSLSECIYIV